MWCGKKSLFRKSNISSGRPPALLGIISFYNYLTKRQLWFDTKQIYSIIPSPFVSSQESNNTMCCAADPGDILHGLPGRSTGHCWPQDCHPATDRDQGYSWRLPQWAQATHRRDLQECSDQTGRSQGHRTAAEGTMCHKVCGGHMVVTWLSHGSHVLPGSLQCVIFCYVGDKWNVCVILECSECLIGYIRWNKRGKLSGPCLVWMEMVHSFK